MLIYIHEAIVEVGQFRELLYLADGTTQITLDYISVIYVAIEVHLAVSPKIIFCCLRNLYFRCRGCPFAELLGFLGRIYHLVKIAGYIHHVYLPVCTLSVGQATHRRGRLLR